MDVAELVKSYKLGVVSLDEFEAELNRTWDITINDDDGQWVTGVNTIYQLMTSMAEAEIPHEIQWEIIGHLARQPSPSSSGH